MIFQILLKTECLPCPAGMDCTDPKEPEFCGVTKTWNNKSKNHTFLKEYWNEYWYYFDGLYPNPNSVGCQDCEPGFFCYFGIKEDCPPGTYCKWDRIVHPEPCVAGSYCKGGSQLDPIPCPAKTYSKVGWNVCESCPAGYFCDGGIIQNCPKGTDLKFSDTIFYFRFILQV